MLSCSLMIFGWSSPERILISLIACFFL